MKIFDSGKTAKICIDLANTMKPKQRKAFISAIQAKFWEIIDTDEERSVYKITIQDISKVAAKIK